MLLTRKSAGAAAEPRLARGLQAGLAKTMDRRTFLKRSGVTAGAAAVAAQLPYSMIGTAEAKNEAAGSVEIKRTVCTHCSVGCAIDAVVENGVWTRHEPVFDSPINLGAHCAKGASIREHGITHDSHRLKYPMKLEGGKWKRISWDQAYEEVSQKLLQIRKESGPDATFWIGSSKHNNEQSYLLCKWVRLFGTNNTDHQARICHSTTVAGIANTWGYGAMTNSYNDEQNSKSLLFFGSNAAEAHPVSMLHTLHAKGNAIVRASAVLMLALGNVGRSGGGTNIYRGHDNVQGATDIGPNPDSLPGYYGLAPGAFAHWARVWNIDLDWLKKQYPSEAMMGKPGITVSRWIDAVTEKTENIDQDSNVRAVIYWGHAPSSQSRGLDMLEAMKKLDLLVVVDPYPSATAAMFAMARKDGAYLLPAATQLETEGSVTASNRSLQWREKVIDPVFESRTDHMIMYQLAVKLGFGDQFVGKKDGKQLIRLVKGKGGEEPSMEDVLRNEINAGCWTIGYPGQSPERLQAHMRNMHVFDVKTTRARGGKDAKTGYDLTGDYFGLPWPCYGHANIKHPGTPLLYDTHKHPMDGGHAFRALFGVEKDGVNLLAEDGVANKGSEITTGYPQFDHVLLKKLGWWDELTDAEKAAAEGKTWANDLSGGIQRVAMKHGCTPFGNAKARAVVWNWPDQIPQHREPLYSPNPDLVAQYPTHDDVKVLWRLPTLFKSVQQKAVKEEMHKKFPLILTSGRLVEYEGGGEETRSNPWLAELQQDNFVEINPKTAADRSIRNGEYVWVSTPSGAKIKVKAHVTEGIGPDTVFIPFHFSGWWQGEDMLPYYPEGAAPIVRGEAVNTATTYGYDRVTMMQETKTTLCEVAKA